MKVREVVKAMKDNYDLDDTIAVKWYDEGWLMEQVEGMESIGMLFREDIAKILNIIEEHIGFSRDDFDQLEQFITEVLK